MSQPKISKEPVPQPFQIKTPELESVGQVIDRDARAAIHNPTVFGDAKKAPKKSETSSSTSGQAPTTPTPETK